MTQKDFKPLTKQERIQGTSFDLQFGLIKDLWASRLLKGNNIIEEKTYQNIEAEFPNLNLIIQWVLQSITIINIDPHLVMKTIQQLIKDAIEKKELLDFSDLKEKEALQKVKTEKLMNANIAQLKEKLNILESINNLIEQEVDGFTILEELEKFPLYHVGIFRTYSAMFKRVGRETFKLYLKKEKEKKHKFSRVDSGENFMKLLKSEYKYIVEELRNLER